MLGCAPHFLLRKNTSPLIPRPPEAGSFSQATFPRKGIVISHHPFGARHVLSALTDLDFGLRVRVEVRPAQRTTFSGAENVSFQAFTVELAKGARLDV